MTDTTNTRKCGNCAAFDGGFCKRYPPTPTETGDYWPFVNDEDWCLEFIPRDGQKGGAS